MEPRPSRFSPWKSVAYSKWIICAWKKSSSSTNNKYRDAIKTGLFAKGRYSLK
jgi:hypothetical protein